MKLRTLLIGLAVAASSTVNAQDLRPEVFDFLNLEAKGLETVKALHNDGKDQEAAAALLDYYRNRKGVVTPEIQDISKVKISAEHQKWADDALEHTFFVHKGYQPSFNYGEDIDWTYWPVKDNELRWQLHRQKWFIPMGKAYRVSGDEKYAIEWVKQFTDWIRKNPIDGDKENVRFAWRPLEVSDRLQAQPVEFQLFIDSPAFTPEFLTEFLVNYHRHAAHIMGHFSKQGNHLLFEAQRLLSAGSFFPEFKDATVWRSKGVDILNKEIGVQVYPDGGQYELDPHYHLASIGIFYNALNIADLNGFRNDFPQAYMDSLEKMMEFYINICFPDYTNPCFSDAKLTTKKEALNHYKKWTKLYPQNQLIKYFATEGKEGSLPEYKSKGFLDSGFFVFRNGWDETSLQMVVKAGPKAFWHCQPDNGTFELWYNGLNLFPDSGSYVYAGEDPEVNEWRNWFRRTASHNTLTFNDKDLEKTESKTLLWQPEGEVQILVTENEGYERMTHRRSIFFVKGEYVVIVDEASGSGQGFVNLHYQMPRGKVPNSREDMHFHTEFEDGSNMKLQVFSDLDFTMKKEEGWVSTAYMKKQKRMNASFNMRKERGQRVRFITVIVPKEKAGDDPSISAKFRPDGSVNVKVGKDKRTLSYILENEE